MQKKSELFFNLILLPIDFLAVVAAFVLAYYIRVKIDGRPVANPLHFIVFLKIFLLIIPVWILIFALSGLYSQSGLRGKLDEIGKLFVAVSGGVMFLIMIDFFSREPIFPAKSIPIYGYGLSFGMLVAARQIVRAVQRYLFTFGVGLHQAVLVGSGEIAQRIAADLSHPNSGYQLIAAVDSARGADRRLKGIKVFKRFDQVVQTFGKRIDEIVQADSALEPDEILEMVNYASNHHIGYRFVPNQFGVYATNSTMGTLAGLPVIEIRHTPLEGWGRIVKRTFDITGALFGLVFASPIFLLVAIAIKLTDPGPVFYRHKRLSRAGQAINILKFRTMYLRYCTGPGYSGKSDEEVLAKDLGRPELYQQFVKNQKLVDDPRVSRVGRLLRRTSLDELPQLFNVLSGDISLVGPRPIVLSELDHYGEVRSTFLALKPGLTGLWQISGRSDLGYEERIKLDIYYVENWSLWLDIRILVKTLLVIFKTKGAY